MKKQFLAVAASVVLLSSLRAATPGDDPVLMTINGKDVTLSEFSYLYNKNNAQQQQPQSIDEYLDLFINFKLKVADAEAAGLDTTADFRKEYTSFRRELSLPYLTDSTVYDRLVEEAYSHMGTDVNVSHIMLNDRNAESTLDSLRALLLSGKADFNQLALAHSIDPAVKTNRGDMGWISAGMYPYAFEEVAYNLPVGEISEPVNSGYGFHIVKVNARRPAKGNVRARHILKLTRGLDEAKAAAAKEAIDSIYDVLIAGADFAEVAKAESQDPGTAKKGGDLGWFSSGRMVQPFDSIAFALKEGEISRPFATTYGYHIVQNLGHRNTLPIDSLRPKIMEAISRDHRAGLPSEERAKQLNKQYSASLNEANIERISREIAPTGSDSALMARLSPIPVYAIGEEITTFGDFMAPLPPLKPSTFNEVKKALTHAANVQMSAKVAEKHIAHIEQTEPSFSNLVKEYRDGILLFDISNRNVWERAAADTAALGDFFRAHRDRYTWDAPRYKGTVISTFNDSLLTLINSRLETLDRSLTPDSMARVIRKEFGNKVKIEYMLLPQGENPIVDYLGFGAQRPKGDHRWKAFTDFNGRVVAQPESAADVKGSVTSDYQAVLERQWLDELHKKYPVKVNKKVLKRLK